jgi:hypothetical protein
MKIRPFAEHLKAARGDVELPAHHARAEVVEPAADQSRRPEPEKRRSHQSGVQVRDWVERLRVASVELVDVEDVDRRDNEKSESARALS